jgi:septal ring factor EnvC (AmiA/AmiB activator)
MSQAKELRLTKEDLTLVHELLHKQQKEIDKLKRQLGQTKSELSVAEYTLRKIVKNNG